MRIAGFADFSPAHQAHDKDRTRMMWQSIREAMPEMADLKKSPVNGLAIAPQHRIVCRSSGRLALKIYI